MEILCYTRQPKEDIIYGKRMAYSMHLAYRGKDGMFWPLHHNEGILYAKAVEDISNGVLDARSMKNPWIFPMANGGYGVAAIRTGAEGEADPDSEGTVLLLPAGIWCIMKRRDFADCRNRAISKRCAARMRKRAGCTGCAGGLKGMAGWKACMIREAGREAFPELPVKWRNQRYPDRLRCRRNCRP